MDKKDKLITLAGGRQFVIIEQCKYNGTQYYFANEIINDDISEVFKIFSINTDENGQEIVENITDDGIIKVVCEILDKKTD